MPEGTGELEVCDLGDRTRFSLVATACRRVTDGLKTPWIIICLHQVATFTVIDRGGSFPSRSISGIPISDRPSSVRLILASATKLTRRAATRTCKKRPLSPRGFLLLMQGRRRGGWQGRGGGGVSFAGAFNSGQNEIPPSAILPTSSTL